MNVRVLAEVDLRPMRLEPAVLELGVRGEREEAASGWMVSS